MKNIKKFIQSTLIMLLIVNQVKVFNIVEASSNAELSARVLEYNNEPNNFDGESTKYLDDLVVNPGQLIQVNIEISDLRGEELTSFDTRLIFDADVVELMYFDDYVEGGIDYLLYAPMEIKNSEIIPSYTPPRGQLTSYWADFTMSIRDTHVYLGSRTQDYTKPIISEGVLMSYLFKVKEDATPGSESTFTFKPIIGESSYGDIDRQNKHFTVKSTTITVKGEAIEENNTLSDIKIEGSTGSGTYDYLEDFMEDKTNYDIVVPPSVDKLTFSHTLTDSTSGTIVNHGKLSGPGGNSVSGFDLAVGDNYFTTAVLNSSGEGVKEYHYTVKRLSNNSNFILTGQDNNAYALTFDLNNETVVRSEADNVDLNISMEDGSEFEYRLSSEEAVIDGNNVTINKDKTDTPFTITFKPEDLLEKYDEVLGIDDERSEEKSFDYKFKRASNDNSLKEVKVKNKANNDLLHEWNSSQDTYTLEVPNEVESIALDILTNHTEAKIMTAGLDNINLKPGDNVIDVKVNAPDGSAKIYTFNIKRVPREKANLSSLSIKVDGVEKNSPITTVNKTTEIVLDYKDSYQLDIEGVADVESGAKLLSGNINRKTIGVGTHSYTLKVQAEDGVTTQNYVVNITVKENSNSKIEGGLKPNPDLIDEILGDGIEDNSIVDENDENNPKIDIYRYSLNVKNSKKTFSMDDLDITLPKESKLVGGSQIDLSVGDNTFMFDIESQDGNSISRYILSINRAKNDIAAITELKVSSNPQGTLTGNFDSGFTYKVASNVLEYTVIASSDDGSIVDSSTVGHFELTESNKVHIVRVTSEDGTDTKEYTINIQRAKSTDATLNAFILSYGDVQNNDIIGSFVNQQYSLNVDKDIEIIDIVAKTTHPKATFTINQTSDTQFNLNYGKNTFNIEVRSESGSFASYTFIVNRAKSDNADLNELRVDGVLVPGWHKDTTNYDLGSVDEHTTSLNITYTAADENAQVKVTGNDLKYGSNLITVEVTAHDGITKKIYTLEVQRELSSSAELGEEGIIPNDKDHNHKIEPHPSEAYRYTVYVPFGTKTYGKDDFILDIDSNAQVVYEKDSINLEETREYRFTVKSPNGKNSQDYIIDIVILDSGVPHLNGIAINGVNVESFEPENYEQVILLNEYLDVKESDFIFTVEKADTIDVTYFNPKISVTGQTVIEQKVTLSNLSTGMTNTYTFKFTRSLTNDPHLSDLTVDKGTMTPSFEENPEGPFVIDVDVDTESININASLSNPNSSLSGDGNIDLIPGENKVNVKVTPENGPEKIYEITINRPLGLEELRLGDFVVDVSTGVLADNTITYTISEPLDTGLLKAYLHVLANDTSVTIEGNVNQDIPLDNQDIKFTLVAKDGKTKLNVVIKYTRVLNDDVRLEKLTSLVSDFEIKNFNPDTFEYTIEVGHDFVTLIRDEHLSWKPMHENTTVTALEKLELSNKEENIYEIKTQSESGKTGKYTLRIIRGTYNFLDGLTIADKQGHIEEQFKPEQLEYNALVYSGVERFSFEWNTQEGVSVKNASALKNLSTENLPNTFTIEVEGDNGAVNEYKVTVSRGVSTRLSNLNTSIGKINFSPNIFEYDVYVAEDSEFVSLIDIVPEDKTSTLSGDYENVKLNGETTTVSITVTNSGYHSKYTVNFKRIKDLTEIKRVIAYDENDIWHSTRKEDGSFEIIVDYGIDLDSLVLSAELVDQSGSAKINEPDKTEEAYHYVISVTDKYGIKKDFNLVLKNDFSDNNYLQSLTVNGKMVKGFNRYATEYMYDNYYTSDLIIEAIAEDENANVFISEFTDNGKGGYINITVTSHKGSPNVYRLNFEKENIAILDSLSLKETGISPQFNKDVNKYYATVPYELDKVTVEYDFSHGGKVLVNGMENRVVELDEGKNIIEVTVTAEDDTSFVYTIDVTRSIKANNYLESLEVSSDNETFMLSPTFEPHTLVYNVEIPNGLETVKVEATYNDRLNVEGLGSVAINGTFTTHQVKVSEYGVIRTYTLNFIQEASSDTSLKELTASKGTLVQLDDIFELKVGNETEVTLNALANHEGARIKGDGLIDLIPGKNIVTIMITAEDGVTTAEYKVVIIRDVVLESVNINDREYTVTLDNEAGEGFYRLDEKIDPNTIKSKVYPTFNDDSVTHSGLEHEITFGTNGSFSFDALTRDREKQNLVVKYERDQSDDTSLEKLIVNNSEIALIGGVYEYEVELPFNFDVFVKDNHLIVTPSHPNAKVNSEATLEIKPGENNEFIFTVKAENGNTQDYVLNLKRAEYDEGPSTLLESLVLDHGQLDFISQNMIYKVKVEEDVDKVILSEIIPVDKNANVSSTYKIENSTMEVPLTDTITNVKITVTNGGYVTIYTVTFEKVKDQTDIKNISVNNGKNIWHGSFDEESGKFIALVDSDIEIEDLNVDVTLEFSGSSSKVEGPFKDEQGNDFYKVTVRDQNGIEKDYELVVKKDKSSNAYLQSLKVFDTTIIGFNKYTNNYSYTIKQDETITMSDISAKPEDIGSNVDIVINENLINIIVTAPNGKENIYSITVEVEEDKITILESLMLVETGISPKFNKNESKYYATIPNEMDKVTVMYTSISNADVEIKSKNPVDNQTNVVSELKVGINEIHVIVSNGGVSYTYTIYVERNKKSDSNFLTDLKVVDYEDETIVYNFSTEFEKDTLVYSVEVPYYADSFNVVGNFEEGILVSGLDTLMITDFPYVHKVRAADQEGIVREYSITFIKGFSNESYLGNLSVSEGNLDPYFKKEITSYNVDVGYDVSSIDIGYLLGAEDQLVTGAGIHNLDVGRNTFEINVRSGNAKTTYTINVHRASDTPRLSDLSVSHGELSPKFEADRFVYHVNVDSEVDEIEIFANSKYTVSGDGIKSVEFGNNIYEIEVKNGSETSITYLIVNKDSEGSGSDDSFYNDNLELAHLDIIGESLNEDFNSNLLEYSAQLSKAFYEELDIVAVARNPKATVSISGNKALDNGTHLVKITVSLSNGKKQITTITVEIDQHVLESDIHQIGEKYIETIAEKQTVLDVKNQMLNDNKYLKIFKDGEELEDTSLVGTGAIIKLIVNEKEYDSKTLIILGDVNGDGEVSIPDRMQAQSYVLGNKLNEAQIIAADVTKDGSIEINDVMLIQAHILELQNIFEKEVN